ncbi:hypothetical protein [Cohnella fermenti]|uniref:Uncharacterized protein n=1 Tax=Cohnella fermenti TaxID=2565925 RepID=A0A4S4BT03_9BACL|nr:hypothetical protein [Cohnella fermenti]THF78014.1 hypothetical protein E6C55_15040 [Cohnella fermenti]
MKEKAKKNANFSEARQKLLPDAFTLLNDELTRAYYEDGDFKTYLGFRLLAMNGSIIELPNTQETQKEYGIRRLIKSGFELQEPFPPIGTA